MISSRLPSVVMMIGGRWFSVVSTLHISPSEFSIRVGAILPSVPVAEAGAGLVVFPSCTVKIGSTFVFGLESLA